MLVLSRRENEQIRLGDSIVVTVVRLANDRVRLGITAPADMLVLRAELESGINVRQNAQQKKIAV
jgi:carbon storage regulator